jgi:AraC family transcriptional regulator
MVNLSPVQDLRQFRNQRSFVSNMLHWDMTLMPRGTPSTWSWNSACDRLDLVLLPDALGEECDVEIVDRFLFRDRELADTCRKLSRNLDPHAGADRLYIESLAIEIASYLVREYSAGSLHPQAAPSGGLSRGHARRVVEYVEANLGNAITIRELAAVAELSPHHFIRMFRETVRVTPHQYVLERRLDRARELLRKGTMRLAEIGLHVGFGSQSHFTSAFHRAFGVTPAEFGRIR